MELKSTVRSLLQLVPTRVGLVFAIFVPMIFTIIWMTGYSGAAERLDRLHIGLVNEDVQKGAAMAEYVAQHAPFQTEIEPSRQDALAKLNEGKTDMVIVIPADASAEAQERGSAKLTYYVNERNSELVKSVMEGVAGKLTAQLNTVVVPDAKPLPIQAEMVKMNGVSDFSTSMLPMILGFLPYIAVMTMNIQFNLASQILKRQHGRWRLFFARQLLLAAVTVVVPFVLAVICKLFLTVQGSFWQVWGFEMLVFAACIAVTQLAFVLFGNAGPLFNIFLIPIQLMTAGNIISASMLSPLYRHLGAFLPVPNGVQGAMNLVYGGGSLTDYAVSLGLITLTAWGLSVLRIALIKEAPAVVPVQSAA
ncbi:YhgE/Pip domain-containing protein [Paenibacillus mucilaginosus]|uniref:YhgE/Pip domain-containing protein n=1 Tax=Paenibacillus mucilaginosus TaxID=61624 RepID=UPI001F391C71|nr:ABC transporter permease [Paenibacillus mucilaginosus]MCG7214497.1 ABC transporter permease [Paenibacillus mucilaginosus]